MPRWWTELLIVAGIYAAYDLSRGLPGSTEPAAMRNGRLILGWERNTHVAFEHALNGALHANPVLEVVSSYYYASLHFVVTIGVLIWMYRAHPGAYRHARIWLALSTVGALVGYWLIPVAPPRLLPAAQFHDVVSDVHQWGWWSAQDSAPPGLGHFANEFAAMPSLHVGWALWSGWLIARHARRGWVRALGVSYPIMTTLVVTSTGNHYLADALCGASLVLLVYVVHPQRWLGTAHRTAASSASGGRGPRPRLL